MPKSHKEQLATCYDTHAKSFAETREKFWPEVDHILRALPARQEKGRYTVVDLGCGAGRLYKYLHDFLKKKKFQYTGVDSAKGMISVAQKAYPDGLFLTQDMLTYLSHQEQESVHAIICLASFHHLETREQRIRALQHAYKTLHYGGRIILVNRSFSQRFFNRYRKRLFASFFSRIFQPHRSRNDILVPWKGKSGTHYRYYHIFTLAELLELAQYTGFVVQTSCYIDDAGEQNNDWQHARNTFVVLEKAVGSS